MEKLHISNSVTKKFYQTFQSCNSLRFLPIMSRKMWVKKEQESCFSITNNLFCRPHRFLGILNLITASSLKAWNISQLCRPLLYSCADITVLHSQFLFSHPDSTSSPWEWQHTSTQKWKRDTFNNFWCKILLLFSFLKNCNHTFHYCT